MGGRPVTFWRADMQRMRDRIIEQGSRERTVGAFEGSSWTVEPASQRLGFEFGAIPGREDHGLLLRLESGAVVGFLAPAKLSEPGVSLVVGGEIDTTQIINQISRALTLQPTELTVLEQAGDHAARQVRPPPPSLLPDLVQDTRMASASWGPNAELASFIMDPHGNFYVSLARRFAYPPLDIVRGWSGGGGR